MPSHALRRRPTASHVFRFSRFPIHITTDQTTHYSRFRPANQNTLLLLQQHFACLCHTNKSTSHCDSHQTSLPRPRIPLQTLFSTHHRLVSRTATKSGLQHRRRSRRKMVQGNGEARYARQCLDGQHTGKQYCVGQRSPLGCFSALGGFPGMCHVSLSLFPFLELC